MDTANGMSIRLPEDLSQRAIGVLRHLQSLPDGKYIIILEKSDDNKTWAISCERRDRIIDRRILQ